MTDLIKLQITECGIDLTFWKTFLRYADEQLSNDEVLQRGIDGYKLVLQGRKMGFALDGFDKPLHPVEKLIEGAGIYSKYEVSNDYLKLGLDATKEQIKFKIYLAEKGIEALGETL